MQGKSLAGKLDVRKGETQRTEQRMAREGYSPTFKGGTTIPRRVRREKRQPNPLGWIPGSLGGGRPTVALEFAQIEGAASEAAKDSVSFWRPLRPLAE